MEEDMREIRENESLIVNSKGSPEEGYSHIILHSDGVTISAGGKKTSRNNIEVSQSVGTIVTGRFSFAEPPSSVQFGTSNVFNDVILSAVPSSILTPIPVTLIKEINREANKALRDSMKDAVNILNSLEE